MLTRKKNKSDDRIQSGAPLTAAREAARLAADAHRRALARWSEVDKVTDEFGLAANAAIRSGA